MRGFSILEILVVIGMFMLIAGLALFMSQETYRGSSFHADRNLLIAALQRARAQAMNNVCLDQSCTDGKPHGVHIQSDTYVLFQGNTYDPDDSTNAVFDSSITTSKSPTTLDIIFSQLSGTTSPTAITLTGGGRTSVISIGAEGQITWTN